MAMDIKTKIMIGIGIALTLFAIIGVIVGVSTHTEAGLMSVCWQLDGSASYDAEGCVSPDEIRWAASEIPLSVSTPGDVGDITEAVDLVNSQVGCTVLEINQNDTDPDVLVLLNEPLLVGVDDAGGATSHHTTGARMTSTVRVFNTTDPYMRLRVLAHELGHVLGLDHDDFESSIMFPTQPESEEMDFIMFSDSDRELLNNLYCHE